MVWPFLLLLGSTLVPANPVQDPTARCGWDASELADGVPAGIAALLARTANPPRQALDDLKAWITSCDGRAGERATSAFRRARARHRNDRALSALLGVSLARGPNVRVKGGTGVLYAAARAGSRDEEEAVKLLAAVGSSEPWPEVGDELALLGLATRRPETLQAAAEVLRNIAGNANASGTWQMLAEVELALGDTAAAATTSRIAPEQGGAAGSRVRGIVRLRGGDEGGAALYLSGIASADQRVLALYLDDLRPLLTIEEANLWSGLSLQERREWLRRSWDWRASQATLSVPERLVEHFRRLYFAYEHYTRQSYRGALPFNALWRNEYIGVPRLDDRGITYVRHGPPDEIIRLSFPGSMEESWMYAGLAGGLAQIDFTKDRSNPEYYVPDPTAAPPPERSSRVRTGSDKLRAMALETYHTIIYNFLKTRVPCGNIWGCAPDRLAPVAGHDARQKWARAVFQSQTATPHLTRPLKAILNTYAFRGPAAGTELAVIFSVHGAEITPADSSTALAYRLRLFAAVEDSASHRVVRADSVVAMMAPRRFDADAVVRYAPVVTVTPAASATIRASVRNLADTLQGQIVRTTRELPAFTAGTFAASDLVIAAPRPGTWNRRGVALEPVAGHRLIADRPFRLFYELYGVTQDEDVDVAIELQPDRPGGLLGRIADLVTRREALTLRFRDRLQLAAPDVAAVTRDITAELEPGEYRLSVTVMRGDGASCTRTAHVVVYRAE